jgi:hypothetical protein
MSTDRRLLFGQRTVAALPIPTDGKLTTYYDTQVTGLCVRVYPIGKKSSMYTVKCMDAL